MANFDWNSALDSLRETIPESQFRTWVQPLQFIRSDNSRVVLSAPNPFHEEWVRNRFQRHLQTVIQHQYAAPVQLEFEIKDEAAEPTESTDSPVQPTLPTAPAKPSLRVIEGDGQPTEAKDAPKVEEIEPALPIPEFSTPYIGLSFNHAAHHFSQLFVKGSDFPMNPLIICGQIGMGKTHLLANIGKMYQEKYPDAIVRYTDTESFSNEFVQAIRSKDYVEMASFKAKYRRHTDLLLFDGLQDLGTKAKTQEELVHAFNEITARGGKVVFTTTTRPQRLAHLIEPLRSRVNSGVLADIQSPSFDDRVKLVEALAGHYQIAAEPAALRTIANQGSKDVRELLGGLLRIHLHAKLENRSIDHQVLESQDWTDEPRRQAMSIEEIIAVVEHTFGVARVELISKSRKGNVNWARQVAMFLARRHTLMSLAQIGASFGRDHATVVHACARVEKDVKNNPRKQLQVEYLNKKFRSSRGEDVPLV